MTRTRKDFLVVTGHIMRSRKNPDVGSSFYGGFCMNDSDQIRISSRTLVELLSGTLDQRRFLEHHRFVPTPECPQAIPFFLHQIAAGRTIKSVNVEKCEHDDDD